MKPTTQTCLMAYCNQNPGNRPPSVVARSSMRGHKLQHSLHTLPRILNSLIRFWSHAPPCRPFCPLSMKPENLAALCCHIRHLEFLSHAVAIAITHHTHAQGWQRVGFGPGFCIPGADPRAKTRNPDPVRILIGFFFPGPRPAPPGPTGPV